MQGNHSDAGYEEYETLLKRVAQARVSQSCFLLTSREKSKELAYLAGQTRPVRTLTLSGLSTGEGREILEDNSLFGSDDLLMDNLVHLSSGNPLTLKVVSNYIHEFLGDDIVGYLQEGRAVMGKIEDVLEQQFLRLSVLEEEAIYWLAIEREAVSLSDLRENLLTDASKKTLPDALLSLQRRSLIETRGTVTFTLQPVIMEYVTERFVQRVCQEFEAETLGILGSHALMKAQSQDYVRESQVCFILNPVVQQLQNDLGTREFAEKCRQMLFQLRATHAHDASYTAGNILHMLIQTGYDLHPFDFSHLTLRQAYLQGAPLHNVNFEQANFIQPLFTDTFGGIPSVAFNPDGSLLTAGTENGEIRIWNTISGGLIHTFRSNSDCIFSVVFSPDGKLLASGSEDHTVRLWDVSTGQCRKILQGHTDTVSSIVFSLDGKLLATGGQDGTIKLWNVGTGESLSTLSDHPGEDIFWSIALSPDGKLLASGSEDHAVRLWDVSTGQLLKTLDGHIGCVRSVAFSPDGKLLASGSDDGTIRLWDVSGSNGHILFEGREMVNSVAFSSDGKRIVSGCGKVYLWDLSASGQPLITTMDYIFPIWSVAFSPDGLIIAGGGEDHMVYLWDANTGQRFKTLSGHTNAITLVAFSPDGKTVASGSNDYTIRLWDVDKGLCTKILQGHTDRVSTVAFSPNGRTIASGSQDGTIKLWSAKTGRCLDTLRSNRPYERMNITGVRGITEAQKTMLEKLGAVEGEGELH